MKKKSPEKIVKVPMPQHSPLDSLPPPKSSEAQFRERFRLLQKKALAGDDIAMQTISHVTFDSLTTLTSVWREHRKKAALNWIVFAIKETLESLELDNPNPPGDLLELTRASHVWPILISPSKAAIKDAWNTIRKTLKVGSDTGYNYYGRKEGKFTGKKKIAIKLWDQIDTFRVEGQNSPTVLNEAWQKEAAKLPPSTRQKDCFALWWLTAWKLFLCKYETDETPFEQNETVKKAFAYEIRMLPKYKNKEGWKEKTNIRSRITAALRQEFRTILPSI